MVSDGDGVGRYIQIMTSVPDKKSGEAIAERLVGKRLAACVQVIGPAASLFSWKGKTERKREWICLIKTRKSLYGKVEKEIVSLHRYEIPEILSFDIDQGSALYLDWLDNSTE